jgi:hypothetical protein
MANKSCEYAADFQELGTTIQMKMPVAKQFRLYEASGSHCHVMKITLLWVVEDPEDRGSTFF